MYPTSDPIMQAFLLQKLWNIVLKDVLTMELDVLNKEVEIAINYTSLHSIEVNRRWFQSSVFPQ